MFLLCWRCLTLIKKTWKIADWYPTLVSSQYLWERCCMSTVFSPLQNKNFESISVGIQEITFNRNCCWKFIMISYQPWTKAKVTHLYCSIFPLCLTPLIIRCFLANWRAGLGLLGGLTIGWGSIWLAEINRLTLVSVFSARSVSLLEFPGLSSRSSTFYRLYYYYST